MACWCLLRKQSSWGQHGAHWVLSAPDGPHVGSMNLAIRVYAAMNLVTIYWANSVLLVWCQCVTWTILLRPLYFQYQSTRSWKVKVDITEMLIQNFCFINIFLAKLKISLCHFLSVCNVIYLIICTWKCDQSFGTIFKPINVLSACDITDSLDLISCCCVEFLLGNIRTYNLHFLSFVNTVNWTPYLWKTVTCLSCLFISHVYCCCGGTRSQGISSLILSEFAHNIPFSPPVAPSTNMV